jgi:hypothetical protein
MTAAHPSNWDRDTRVAEIVERFEDSWDPGRRTALTRMC